MNAINIIHPYKHQGSWVFDDDKVSLIREPFVGGADTIIDILTREIENASAGFSLTFSATTFPGSQHRLEWQREADGGNVYLAREIGLEGWLCPALFRYFDTAPKNIFVQIEASRK